MGVNLEKEGQVGILVLDRPPANSYDYKFLRSLAGAIDDARSDADINAVVVTSASEKFFSAGADVGGFAAGTGSSGAAPSPPQAAVLPHYVGKTHIYSPLNSAFRFSPNALMPSSASCDTNTRLIASRSIASPTSSGAP